MTISFETALRKERLIVEIWDFYVKAGMGHAVDTSQTGITEDQGELTCMRLKFHQLSLLSFVRPSITIELLGRPEAFF